METRKLAAPHSRRHAPGNAERHPPLTLEQDQLRTWFITSVKSDPAFVHVADVSNPLVDCGVWLKDGGDLPCIAVAMDVLGNWTVLTYQNVVRQYFKSEVR
jgi:hypothetical protein